MDFFLIPERFRRWIPLVLSVMTGVTGSVLAWTVAPLFPIMAIAVGFILGSLGMLLFISLLVHFFLYLRKPLIVNLMTYLSKCVKQKLSFDR